jgi:2'-5' RNA ligase
MRLFFSLPLPDDVRAALRPAIDGARSTGRGVSFGKIEQLHFTLAFLGDQPESRIDPACAAAEEAVRGIRGFDLAIGGPGAFPSLGKPRVLWLGVPKGGSQLVEVATRLDAQLRRRGFELEERPFRAHLTMGRVRPRGERDARGALSSMPRGELASFRADEIGLVHSVLGPGGAKHTAIRSFPLLSS